MKIIIKFTIIFFLILNPFKVDSAEILQIENSNKILVGDQNRTLEIKLYCVEVNDNNEQEAINLLRKEFPRGSKVKIKPFGFKENILLAKVFNLKNNKEMSELLIDRDFIQAKCIK